VYNIVRELLPAFTGGNFRKGKLNAFPIYTPIL